MAHILCSLKAVEVENEDGDIILIRFVSFFQVLKCCSGWAWCC